MGFVSKSTPLVIEWKAPESGFEWALWSERVSEVWWDSASQVFVWELCWLGCAWGAGSGVGLGSVSALGWVSASALGWVSV